MLHEDNNIRQIEGDPPRRWWSDEFFDLIVWSEPDGSVWGFQLCYDRGHAPRALTWTKAQGYSHAGIDDGEGSSGAHKGSPVLVRDGNFDTKSVGARLADASGGLPSALRVFIADKVYTARL